MPFLRDRVADHLFELDLLRWDAQQPQTFYEAQLLVCRVGIAGNGVDRTLEEAALYRWELDALLEGLRGWLTGERPRASFRFLERSFEFDVRSGDGDLQGSDEAVVSVALREGLEGELQLGVSRSAMEEFLRRLSEQAGAFLPRGREWKELFAQHYPGR